MSRRGSILTPTQPKIINPFECVKIKRVGDPEEDQHNSKINLSEFNTCGIHCTQSKIDLCDQSNAFW